MSETDKWCAWCGNDILDNRRKFCNNACAADHWRDIHNIVPRKKRKVQPDQAPNTEVPTSEESKR